MVREPRLWAVVILLALVVVPVPASAAGVLTGVSVSLADATAGATGTATVSFTTASGLAATDRIEVTFPVGFDLSGVGAGDGSCSTMDGSFSTTVVGQLVRITRSGGTSQGAAAETCTIADVKNPGFSGLTGTFTVETYTEVLTLYTLADAGLAAALTIDPATLTGVDVQPASLVAGATSTSTITFTTANLIPEDGRIQVTFPAGFDVGGATDATCAGMDGAFATSTSGQTVTIARSGGTAEPAGAQSCTVDGVENPPQSGSTGTYAVSTLTSLLAVIDRDLAVAADTLLAAALASTNVQPASLVAGATGAATVGFTTTNPVPSDGRVRVTFPAGFDLSGVGASDGACSSMDGSFSTSVSGQVVTIARSGGTSEPAGVQACSIADVKNPAVSGSAGAYAVSTLTSALAAVDEDLAVAADTILAGTLTGVDVEPADHTKGATSTVTATFTTLNPLPADGVVEVTFPAGFDLSGVGAADGSCSSMDGSFATSVSGQLVTITRSGGTAEPAGGQTCTIADVTNPADVGTTASFAVKTLNGVLAAIDWLPSVPGSDIVTGGVSAAVATLSNPSTGALSDITFTWTGTATVPDDGKLVFTFPSGLAMDGMTFASCSLAGTISYARSDATVTLTRLSGGDVDPGVRSCTFKDIQLPGVAGTTGTFAVDVQTGAGASQEGGVIPGVTFTGPDVSGGGGGGGGGAGAPAADSGSDGSDAGADTAGDDLLDDLVEERVEELEKPAEGIESILLEVLGDANLTVTRMAPQGSPPAGFKGTDVYFEITLVTGTLQKATIATEIPKGVDPDRAVLLHKGKAGWEALPGKLSGGRLLAVTTSFSPFWLVEDVQGPEGVGLSIDRDGVLHAEWKENQGRATARIWIDGELVASAANATTLEHNITKLKPGEHRITLQVIDPAGHEAVERATLDVDEHGASVSAPIVAVPGPAVPLAAAALLALAFVLRRRLL